MIIVNSYISLCAVTITAANITPGIHPQHVAKHNPKNIAHDLDDTNKTTKGGQSRATKQAIVYIRLTHLAN